MENAELIKALRCKECFDLCNVESCRYHLTNTKSGCKCAIKLMATDAASALEAADKRVKELEGAQRWIPVGDRLPRSNKPVQVYMPKLYMSVQTGFYDRYYGEDDDEWYEHWVAPSEVTHWQPLPQPPQKGE